MRDKAWHAHAAELHQCPDRQLAHQKEHGCRGPDGILIASYPTKQEIAWSRPSAILMRDSWGVHASQIEGQAHDKCLAMPAHITTDLRISLEPINEKVRDWC